MPGGKGKLNGKEDGKAWVKGQSGNPNGRPLSFKTQFRRIQKNGGTIIVHSSQVKVKNTKTGNWMKVYPHYEYHFQLSKVEQYLVAIDQVAMRGKGSAQANMLKFLWEQFDGKAKQAIDVSSGDKPIKSLAAGPQVDWSKLTKEETAQVMTILAKAIVYPEE